MGERIIVRQDSDFITEVLAVDPHDPESDEFSEVHHLHQLTPYGMLMASIASCTGIVLHTYAQHHSLPLEKVELHLEYDRIFAEDCEDCEQIGEYQEHIEEEIHLSGDLTQSDKERLYRVSLQCPIHKIVSHGAEVKSYLAEE
jgi:putative redox protein